MQAGRYYRWTGTTPPAGVTLCALAALIVSPLLGAIYGVLDAFSPIVYINILVGLGASSISGWCVARAAIYGRVRNSSVVLLAGVLAGVLVFYASWVSWLAGASKGELVFFDPVKLTTIASALSVEGVWNLSHNSDNVSGAALWAVWAIEGVLLLGMAPYMAHSTFNDACYCESCQVWMPSSAMVAALAPVSDKGRALRMAFEAGDWAYAQRLGPVEESRAAEGFTELQLRSCQDCTRLHLLTASSLSFTRDKKGELQAKRKPIFSNLVVDSVGLEKLRASLPAAEQQEAEQN